LEFSLITIGLLAFTVNYVCFRSVDELDAILSQWLEADAAAELDEKRDVIATELQPHSQQDKVRQFCFHSPDVACLSSFGATALPVDD
jgi:hypothetical protein